eukprot:11418048-Alexandrium_andersonii.AAC.1
MHEPSSHLLPVHCVPNEGALRYQGELWPAQHAIIDGDPRDQPREGELLLQVAGQGLEIWMRKALHQPQARQHNLTVLHEVPQPRTPEERWGHVVPDGAPALVLRYVRQRERHVPRIEGT